MKTILFILLFLGYSPLYYSQIDTEDIEPIELENVVISSLNAAYINKVQDKNTPKVVKELENIAAKYDITESDMYDSKFDAYEVIFKDLGSSKGRIIATYNSKGRILSSIEKYYDVRLPKEVITSIASKYPGWRIMSDTYVVSYYEDWDYVKKSYKIQIKKDKSRKHLKVAPSGLITKK